MQHLIYTDNATLNTKKTCIVYWGGGGGGGDTLTWPTHLPATFKACVHHVQYTQWRCDIHFVLDD